MRFSRIIFVIAVLCLLLVGQTVFAELVLNEIMYDLKTGADDGREWVEILNNGASEITIATSSWKFFEGGSNHELSLYQGEALISPGGFAVIADNPQKFLADWPGFGGIIFDSSFSLSNSGESVALKSNTMTVVDQFSYAAGMGGAGDGKSLQKIAGAWSGSAPTPGAANASSGADSGDPPNSTATSSDNQNTDQNRSSETGNSSGSDDSSASNGNQTSWPAEPQIFSRIIGPSSVIAGADIVLRGEALGLEKKPLENARFFWNFGDGAIAEGLSALHSYNFPGKYVVVLEASSGKFSGSSRLQIEVIPTPIIIKSLTVGPQGKIEIGNEANIEIDLSWWRVRSGNQFFTIPKNTKILPKSSLALSPTVMGFPLGDADVAILYPNGAVALSYQKPTPSILAEVSAPPSKIILANKSEEKPSPAPATPPVLAELTAENEPESAKEISAPEEGSLQTAALPEALKVLQNAPPSRDNAATDAASRQSPWLYFLGGVIVLGTGFAFWPKRAVGKDEAEEIKIIED